MARISDARVLLLVGLVVGAGVAVAAVSLPPDESIPVDGGVPFSSANNNTVVLQGDTNVSDPGPFTDNSDELEFITESGNVTVESGGDTSVSLFRGDITSEETRLTDIHTGGNWITVDPEDKHPIGLNGDVGEFYWSEYEIDDGERDFYISGPDDGTGDVRYTTLPDDTRLAARDSDSGELLDVIETTDDGVGTFTIPLSSHDVELQTYSGDAPELSNPSPEGDLSSEPSDVSVDVDDEEFDEGDEVTVNFSVDGDQIHSETVDEPSTVSASIPSDGQTGGEHDVSAEATDKFGSSQSESWQYSLPDTLYIRNESDPDDILNSSDLTYNVTWYGGEEIVGKTQNGEIDMDGLPVDQSFVVDIDPENGSDWTPRQLYVSSIYESQDAYLLNESRYQAVESRFVLNDPTGEYGGSSVIGIQRALNQSDELRWRTIQADRFGVEGMTATLEEGVRYRVYIRNDDGEQQVVGPYRGAVSESVEVEPGSPVIDLPDFEDGRAAAASIDNRTVEWRYADAANDTQQMKVFIHEKGDRDNLLVPNATYFDLGNASQQLEVSENESEKTWVVNFIGTRNDEEFTISRQVTNRPALFDALGSNWQAIIGVSSLVLLAGVFSVLNAALGAVIVSLMGGLLWWIGLLGGVTTGIAVALALTISVINHLRTTGGP